MKNLSLCLLSFLFLSNASAESCDFPTRDGMTNIDSCAAVSIKISKDALSKIKFDSNGLAGGSVGSHGCFWLKKSGEIRKTHCYDNGADAFSDGLARYVDEKGLFGFMNTALKVTIKPQFTFAFPFTNGAAWVCNGCQTVKAKDSEHSTVEGGSWMVIDKKGRITKKCLKAFDYQSCLKT